MIRARHPLALALVLVTSALAFGADRIEMRDGRALVGEIASNKDGIVRVKTADGVVSVLASEVLRIVPAKSKTETGSEAEDRGAEPVRRVVRRTAGDEERPVGDLLEDGAEMRGAPREAAAPSGPTEGVPRARRAAARAALEKVAAKDPVVAAVLAIAKRLESEDHEERGAAAQEVLETWPQSRAVLAIVFNVGSDTARIEATSLLRDERLGDTSPLVRSLLRDPNTRVRIHALRAAYARRMVTLEPDVLAILDSDAPWPVRQDAARALERIGGEKTFAKVVTLWATEDDPQRRRRMKRVMRAIAGQDLGDDSEAWHQAVAQAFLGERVLRDPKAGPVIQKPAETPPADADESDSADEQ